MFRLLFDNPERAAELYYALTGVKCNPDEIQIITITTTISGRLKNDLAFVVANRAIICGEHQSTTSENMPVRFLMYIGLLYEKWIKMQGEEEFLYSTKLLPLPTPEFVVFYNGITKRPDKETLYLSSAFKTGSRDDKALGSLELEVPVYNINKGINENLFEKSETLRQYSEFIAKFHDNKKTFDLDRAVKETIEYCVKNDILVEFLREHGGKIVSILSAEYNEEAARRVHERELREDIAIIMLKKKIDIDIIAECTGIPREKLLEMQRELA